MAMVANLEAGMLDRIVASIVDTVAPEKIILLGSTARGDAHADSDVDLLVVKDQCRPRETAARVYRGLPRPRPAVDVVVAWPEDLVRHRDSHWLVIAPALREGRTIHEEPSKRAGQSALRGHGHSRGPTPPPEWPAPEGSAATAPSQGGGDAMNPRRALEADAARQWIHEAQDHLKIAAKHEPGLNLRLLCSHAHCGAEKAVKAVIIALGESFPYVHDIGRLLDRAEQVAGAIPDDVRKGAALTLYGDGGRYPDVAHEREPTTRAEYEQAMADAAAVVGWAVRRAASLLPAAAPDPA